MNLEDIRSTLEARYTAREQVLAASRAIIRSSANAIRSLHRSEWDQASELIAEAGSRLQVMLAAATGHVDMGSGAVSDASKEYAEARLTQAIFTNAPWPGPDEMGVDAVPYLHGLGEAVGEMRRRMLDLLRRDELAEATRLLEDMDGIVDRLAGIDYPDGMTNGLRRTTDIARSLVERSRSDLTLTVVQERLRDELTG